MQTFGYAYCQYAILLMLEARYIGNVLLVIFEQVTTMQKRFE